MSRSIDWRRIYSPLWMRSKTIEIGIRTLRKVHNVTRVDIESIPISNSRRVSMDQLRKFWHSLYDKLQLDAGINLFFLFICIGTTCVIFAEDPRNNEWELTETIWNFGIISSCDIGLDLTPIEYFKSDYCFNPDRYRNIQNGDIVWVKCRFLVEFYRRVLFKIQNPFVMVISDGDESFPSDSGLRSKIIEKLINSDKVIHIFAQNCDYNGSSNKVTHMPIGMDFHTIAYKDATGGWGEIGSPLEQENILKNYLITFKPTHMRKKKAFVDFQHSDSMRGGEFKRYLQFGEDRTSIFNRLVGTGLIDFSDWMRRSSLWLTKGQYAFSISPHGNGLDCHRTWEDLVLGCIVIVKTSPLDKMYKGLPVVIVNDWDEITPENLEIWLEQYKDAFTNPAYRKKLTLQYWLKQIKDVAYPYKNKINTCGSL